MDQPSVPSYGHDPLEQSVPWTALRTPSLSRGYVPIVQINHRRWMLDPPLANNWHSLETWCRKAVIGMMNISQSCFLPCLFQLQAMPERFRYRGVFLTQQDAENAVQVARNAFLPLIGALSLMSLIFQHLEMYENLTFDWQERLATETGVHPPWVSCLEDSVLFDLKEPRVGGIIYVEEWRGVDAALFPFFRHVNMPIFLGWG